MALWHRSTGQSGSHFFVSCQAEPKLDRYPLVQPGRREPPGGQGHPLIKGSAAPPSGEVETFDDRNFETTATNREQSSVGTRGRRRSGGRSSRRGRSAKLIEAIKDNRYGHRDATMVLFACRHGLRAAELVGLRWDQIDFEGGVLHVARRKRGTPSTHPISGRELRALRRLERET